MSEFDIPGFLRHFGGLVAALPMAEHNALEQAALIVEKEAKDLIGSEHPFWPQLADATIADRERKGYPADEPLLRTGELRGSIEHKVEGHVAHVGSDLDIAVYQELGTSKMPPRSFLGQAAIRKTDAVVDLIGHKVHTHLIGKSVG